MYQTSLTSILTITLTLFISIYNPVMAKGLDLIGQADIFSETEEIQEKNLYPPPKREMEKEIDVQAFEKASSPKPNAVTQAKENVTASMPVRPVKRLGKINREFIHLVKTSDVTRLDLRKPSGLNHSQADALLKGTGLEGLGKAFVETEERYQVNAYYLIAHAAWESGWGKSRISKEKNNLFGFSAYDKSPYRSAKKFDSKEDGIDTVAQYISENYLHENGRYYHGPHLKGMNVRYASDPNWQKGIASVMYSLAKKTPTAEDKLVAKK
ncbi:N-acetylglucosaminidase [Ammoniphilus sp. 3BR4]|uniref:N-acetylglucosaminidase n=1 Tax=Ammoniphilus sp. 3BR4 TaxID=3158265 RepID=UPI003465C0F5